MPVFPHRGRSRAAGVAARARLREPEAAEYPSSGENGHVAPTLRVVAEVDYRRRSERRVRRDGDGMRGIDLCHLVNGDDVTREIQTRSTKLLGPGNAEE